MTDGIRWIAGLGNPRPKYQGTRHNVGADWLELFSTKWSLNKDLRGEVAKTNIAGVDISLFLPATYMNESGQALALWVRYYKIPLDTLLIAYDDIDLPVGSVRLKFSGGHGGHNGMRDIIRALGTEDFWRLRIGVAHPGDRDRVMDHVLSAPNRADKEMIQTALSKAESVLPDLVSGHRDRAMQALHTGEA